MSKEKDITIAIKIVDAISDMIFISENETNILVAHLAEELPTILQALKEEVIGEAQKMRLGTRDEKMSWAIERVEEQTKEVFQKFGIK